jgi:hypothetical protein
MNHCDYLKECILTSSPLYPSYLGGRRARCAGRNHYVYRQQFVLYRRASFVVNVMKLQHCHVYFLEVYPVFSTRY